MRTTEISWCTRNSSRIIFHQFSSSCVLSMWKIFKYFFVCCNLLIFRWKQLKNMLYEREWASMNDDRVANNNYFMRRFTKANWHWGNLHLPCIILSSLTQYEQILKKFEKFETINNFRTIFRDFFFFFVKVLLTGEKC